MTRTPIKLLISDVDGTLVGNDKVLTSRAREAVERLRSANIQFTITSSRPPRGMATLTEALQLKVPIAAFNGGMFVRPDLSMLDQHTLAAELVAPIIDTLASGGLDDFFVERKRERHGTSNGRRGCPARP